MLVPVGERSEGGPKSREASRRGLEPSVELEGEERAERSKEVGREEGGMAEREAACSGSDIAVKCRRLAQCLLHGLTRLTERDEGCGSGEKMRIVRREGWFPTTPCCR